MGLFGTADPVKQEFEAIAAEYRDLRAADSDRIDRYRTYREENESTRTVSVDQHVADLTDYGRRHGRNAEPARHRIPLPFGMAMTVKHAYRIAGRLPDVVVDRREETALERHRSDVMEKIVWAIIRESRGETQLASAAWDGSQLGASVLDLYWSIERQMPLLRACDPAGFVVVKGVDDPHAFQRVYRSWDVPLNELRAEYREQAFRGEPVRSGDIRRNDSGAGTQELCTVVQMCDRHRIVRFTDGGAVPLYEYQHDYGFTPYVVIPNVGPERNVWGWADYEFVRALVHYIPALFSREADILRAVANGAYVSKGTGVNPDTVRRILGQGGIVESKREGTIEAVQAAEVPAFEIEHANRALEFLKMLGFTPDAAWGGQGATSGADRGLQLMPLIELTAMKQSNWVAGLSRLFGMGYRMIEQKMIGKQVYRGARLGQGNRRTPFRFTLGPDAAPTQAPNPAFNADDPAGALEAETIDLPNTPRELFDADYEVRFIWQNRIDPDDPAFVISELNKFQQGAQSLRTTLERLGVQAPEDEMKLIEEEADRLPWLRNGMIALIKAQLQAEAGNAAGGGTGSATGNDQTGAGPDDLGALFGAAGTVSGGGGGQSGALNQDAGSAALPGGGGLGQLYGGA